MTIERLNMDRLASDVLACGFRLISPEQAGSILRDRNPRNRSIAPMKLAQVCSDIREGRFLVNGESVIFDRDGNLLDGQHRLAAAEKTGQDIVSLCAFGIDPDAMRSIDTGKSRTPGDIIQISGYAQGNRLAAIARLVICYRDSDGIIMGRTAEISIQRIIEFADSHPGIADVELWSARHIPGLTGICSSSQLAAARIILEGHYGPRVVEYLDQIGSGANIAAGDPAFAVRRALASASRLSPKERLEAIMRGAVAFMQGREMSRVSITGRMPPLKKG